MIAAEDAFAGTGASRSPPLSRWSWTDALALASPGERYVVHGMLFDLVRDRCRELGCFVGSELLCTSNDHDGVSFLTTDGSPGRLERAYAWFVGVTQAELRAPALPRGLETHPRRWRRSRTPALR